jgi:hypothetical protein
MPSLGHLGPIAGTDVIRRLFASAVERGAWLERAGTGLGVSRSPFKDRCRRMTFPAVEKHS